MWIKRTTSGITVGKSGEKVAFLGSTPIVQRVGAAQAAVATTGSTTSTPYGFTSAAQADALVTLVNELRAALVAFGLIKGAA
jgi:UDP-N-acetyl-D-mannosaminuronic acid transferase (WecB/TagA/CpsF family)